MQIFISACKGNANDDANMERLHNDLTALGVRRIDKVIGKYKGTIENSFAITLGDAYILDVVNLARKYEQESILLVMIDDNAFLKFIDQNDLVNIGIVKYSDSEPQGDYSYFPSSGKYMTVLE